jgi:hypothetical protein
MSLSSFDAKVGISILTRQTRFAVALSGYTPMSSVLLIGAFI